MDSRWQFWIDRGGTFTDCIGTDPQGQVHTTKVLSSNRAPLVGIRQLMGLGSDEAIPPCDIRMGTTLATNALLEREGSPTGLIITKGFADLLAIGNQSRPDLFALQIRKPEVLCEQVVELDARMDAEGTLLQSYDSEQVRLQLVELKRAGIVSIAIAMLHSYKNSTLEMELKRLCEEVGFSEISLSSEASGEMGYLSRSDTTVVDAYLTPMIRDYLKGLQEELPGSSMQIMQSSGGLCSSERFRGKDAVLSGPAGGVLAFSSIAEAAGYKQVIGFDMGGTSTDVSSYQGELRRVYESEVAGVRLKAPMMEIHTVASGGGSVCEDNGFRFTVGPKSVGSTPGPLCYGHADASELSVTDCNLFLGRVVDDRFPFSLDSEKAKEGLLEVRRSCLARGLDMSLEEIAAGFVAIANASMATAIREVSVARGQDLRDFAMMVFGGAGGQHACAVAAELGITSVLLDPLGGVLSAYGMGLAPTTWHGQRDAGLLPVADLASLESAFIALEEEGASALHADGAGAINKTRWVDLRYVGTQKALPIPIASGTEATILLEAFGDTHEGRYGYQKASPVEIVTLRVECASPSESQPNKSEKPKGATLAAARPLRTHELYCDTSFKSVPVFGREQLAPGQKIEGPALLLDSTGTLCLDSGWAATLDSEGRLHLENEGVSQASSEEAELQADPISLEIFGNLFMSIAVQMGRTLQNTAISTNIRERLDFSCAVFDRHGDLVANAPHIPVHLGAMGESIRGILERHPSPKPGSVFASNDPSLGGSHLPDITVVTPIHSDSGDLIFFTASRGHHADVGGSTPGSMPPFSTSLAEEGVVFRAQEIVREGRLDEEGVLATLQSGQFPARNPMGNIADLKAQIAANQRGAWLLREMLRERGQELVLRYMGFVQDNAAEQVASAILQLEDGEHRFEGTMDEGAKISVCMTVKGDFLTIDFKDSSPQVAGNLNAPRAVTVAAVMYVLRLMVASHIPLNAGCLRCVRIETPFASIVNPEADCAVAAGNVETSQRIVDVLLGALQLAAASQGTMNNLSFGNGDFGYYETIAGGAGATALGPGADGVHTHMTNTRITDPEILEARFPIRLWEFSIRRGSSGSGLHRGGEGLVREMETLEPLSVSIISERRSTQPFGIEGGGAGKAGRNSLNGQELPAKTSFETKAGDRIRVETPGGGGYGLPAK